MGRYVASPTPPSSAPNPLSTNGFNNRCIFDTPGCYTFTFPDGVDKAKVIAVGGGGPGLAEAGEYMRICGENAAASHCTLYQSCFFYSNCSSAGCFRYQHNAIYCFFFCVCDAAAPGHEEALFACGTVAAPGAGGGYAEKTITPAAGCAYTVCVGGVSETSSFGAEISATGGTASLLSEGVPFALTTLDLGACCSLNQYFCCGVNVCCSNSQCNYGNCGFDCNTVCVGSCACPGGLGLCDAGYPEIKYYNHQAPVPGCGVGGDANYVGGVPSLGMTSGYYCRYVSTGQKSLVRNISVKLEHQYYATMRCSDCYGVPSALRLLGSFCPEAHAVPDFTLCDGVCTYCCRCAGTCRFVCLCNNQVGSDYIAGVCESDDATRKLTLYYLDGDDHVSLPGPGVQCDFLFGGATSGHPSRAETQPSITPPVIRDIFSYSGDLVACCTRMIYNCSVNCSYICDYVHPSAKLAAPVSYNRIKNDFCSAAFTCFSNICDGAVEVPATFGDGLGGAGGSLGGGGTGGPPIAPGCCGCVMLTCAQTDLYIECGGTGGISKCDPLINTQGPVDLYCHGIWRGTGTGNTGEVGIILDRYFAKPVNPVDWWEPKDVAGRGAFLGYTGTYLCKDPYPAGPGGGGTCLHPAGAFGGDGGMGAGYGGGAAAIAGCPCNTAGAGTGVVIVYW